MLENIQSPSWVDYQQQLQWLREFPLHINHSIIVLPCGPLTILGYSTKNCICQSFLGYGCNYPSIPMKVWGMMRVSSNSDDWGVNPSNSYGYMTHGQYTVFAILPYCKQTTQYHPLTNVVLQSFFTIRWPIEELMANWLLSAAPSNSLLCANLLSSASRALLHQRVRWKRCSMPSLSVTPTRTVDRTLWFTIFYNNTGIIWLLLQYIMRAEVVEDCEHCN